MRKALHTDVSPVTCQESLIECFIDNLWLERGLSKNTLEAYRRDLSQFETWLFAGFSKNLILANATDLQVFLGEKLRHGVSPRSSARFLSSIRNFYRWALRDNLITEDPSLRIENPRLGRLLPKSLSEEAVDRLLLAPDLVKAIEFRDRAMLELLYACGIRVSELTTLEMTQVSFNQGVIRVVGKGGKERLIPMGEEALDWLSRYLRGPRDEILHNRVSDALFPSNRGNAMTRQSFLVSY